MSTHRSPASATATGRTFLERLSPAGRLLGLDAARGIALFAMMVTHIFELSDLAGFPTWAAVFAGRASALFAVLAGCSLVLSTRSRMAESGRLLDAVPSVLIRAGSIIVIGLCLGSVSTLLAVILVNYGVMFAIAMLFLRLRARILFPIALGWMLLSPVLSMLIRSEFGLESMYHAMSWFELTTPLSMLQDLVLTGYYPILQWLSYILLGMAVAKIDIGRHLISLFALGFGLLLVGKGVSWLLINVAGGGTALVRVSELYGTDLNAALFTGSYGVTPPTSWWWLAIAGPHSGTPFDMTSTAGTALLTIAVCQSLAVLLGRRAWALAPLTAAGSMPLSVYSAHVVLLEITRPWILANPMLGGEMLGPRTVEFCLHAIIFIGFALVWKLTIGTHGPLEGAIAAIIRSASPGPGQAQGPGPVPDSGPAPGSGPVPGSVR
ncbi:heparan-alpha-glucosaminide N-acetyltransferase domain-containing protein [Brevibacterium marinum]|uniref:Putative membrane protein n=1 Tax=Brevibacterium marinum TaxID=418643 RepID=A0A846RSA2_9MICO|nr:heparan-alpha-glucosaminide N-acetyltransferase domain-containing protein [Brevibacterium marinum]NJC56934.1 putative membrane protein [Brevibacterium marinum]